MDEGLSLGAWLGAMVPPNSQVEEAARLGQRWGTYF